MHPDQTTVLNPHNLFVAQCEALRNESSNTVPLRELIRNGGFIFAMCVLTLLAILMATMGLSGV